MKTHQFIHNYHKPDWCASSRNESQNFKSTLKEDIKHISHNTFQSLLISWAICLPVTVIVFPLAATWSLISPSTTQNFLHSHHLLSGLLFAMALYSFSIFPGMAAMYQFLDKTTPWEYKMVRLWTGMAIAVVAVGALSFLRFSTAGLSTIDASILASFSAMVLPAAFVMAGLFCIASFINVQY